MNWFRIIALCTLLGIAKVTYANMPTSSGYYEVDSLYIEIDWPTSEHEVIEFRLNSFSENDYSIYKNGLWIYDRSFSENTWEDKIFMDYDCIFPVDEFQKRGKIYKVNTLSVRTRNTITNQITKDSVYIYALFKNPFDHYTFFATIDEEERIDMMVNFRDKLNKKAWLHIFNPKGELEVSQAVVMDLAGNASLCIANKGVAFKASNKEPALGPNRFVTSLWNDNEEVKKIKLRSGGGGQSDAFGGNEIVMRILSSPELTYQNVNNTVGTWYLNGSYWSLTFPQSQINERHLSNILEVHKNQIDILEPFGWKMFLDQENPGCSPYSFSEFDFQPIGIQYICEEEKCFFIVEDNSGDPEPGIIPANYTEEKSILAYPTNNGKYQLIGFINEGEGTSMKEYLIKISKAISEGKTLNNEELNQLLDLDNFLQYIAVINYLDLTDIVFNNVEIVSTLQDLPFLIFEDFDEIAHSKIDGNNWGFIDYDSECLGILHETIKKLILDSPEAVERLQLVYQDLLNSTFLPKRTSQVIDQLRSELMPYYTAYHESWGGAPNGGFYDSIQQERLIDSIKAFFQKRPKIGAEQLMAKFQPERNYQFSDRNKIHIIFDSVPKGVVQVQLNSLTIQDNFEGYYFPTPNLQLNYTVQEGYVVYIEEFPETNGPLELPLNQHQTITFKIKHIPQSLKENL